MGGMLLLTKLYQLKSTLATLMAKTCINMLFNTQN